MSSPSNARLSRLDWTDAALQAMAEGGTAAVNIEQLAQTLGATKGSFYHHFDSRHGLLQAALDRWEEIVAADIAAGDNVADARRRLFDAATVGVGTGLDGFVDIALATSLDNPSVAAALRRVTEQRVQWLRTALEELGVPPATSRVRAIRGLASYMGLYLWQLISEERLDTDAMRAQIDCVIAALLAE